MGTSPSEIEEELKKRLAYPYCWGRVQNNLFDFRTKFVYEIFRFEELLSEINHRFGGDHDYHGLMMSK